MPVLSADFLLVFGTPLAVLILARIALAFADRRAIRRRMRR